MKKKQLEILLERLDGFPSPSPLHEQYSTPASVAAEMLFHAYMHGDLGVVCDLGCGTGILAIGAALLGARAIGVEIDRQALAEARRNAKKLGVHVDFVLGSVSSISLKGIDTVVMNPPFGAQRASVGDRAFLSKAMEVAKTIYSIHNKGSEGFIRRFVEPCVVQEIYRIPFQLKRCFEFHSKDVKTIEVELYRITC
ncbi:MAG: tRNA (uracil(54)-C(5))-methyltransferase [Methanosaeta sp. PtaB.Bin018]|jgi:putative methylase|nr:methyltransferase [Methanothrix sp.]OPX75241.1 MAG: tRNA (uracil(54)-C(5))-methyltransferase [Methanosaeta sp. PtaB.Bin018]OPY43640.1 MAG: tRNA (uracil(54)-C(5))-methyltransferase [Methanosaeta sp. PtaU1.Bin016]HOV52050.1 METTL5 family protein [Methanothrix sp.]